LENGRDYFVFFF